MIYYFIKALLRNYWSNAPYDVELYLGAIGVMLRAHPLPLPDL